MADRAHEAAADEVRNVFGFDDEAPEEVSDPEPAAAEDVQQEAATAEVQQEQEQVPAADFAAVISPELPEDLAALLEQPDFEAEAELEVEDEETWEEYGDVDDPRLHEERKLRIAAEKKAAFFEQQRLKSERGKWEQEAAKFFPLADPSRIDAKSRRAFLRAAKAEHDARIPFLERALEKTKAELAAELEAEKKRMQEEMEAAWGRPLSAAGVTPGQNRVETDEVETAYRRGGLKAGILAELRRGTP